MSQLKNEIKSRDNEIHELRSQIVEIQQEGMKKETGLRELLEDQEDDIRKFKAEVRSPTHHCSSFSTYGSHLWPNLKLK